MNQDIRSRLNILATNKSDIESAIISLGGSLSQNPGFSTFASDIGTIPFMSGVETIGDNPQQSLTISNLPFSPNKIFIVSDDAHLHLGSNYMAYYSIWFDSSGSYKFLMFGVTLNVGISSAWTSNASGFITINNDGFTIYRAGSTYAFAPNSNYFWIAFP